MSGVDQQPASPCVVLLAEDEPVTRMLAVDVLTEAGFTILEARHAAEVLVLLEAQADSIHVLFTDVHMPGALDGLGLARHAREHWPWLGILIASGAAQPASLELPPGSRFVAKPYKLQHVVGHVRELASAC